MYTGTASSGQGHETTFAQIASEELGVPYDDIDVVHGDTEKQPFGTGTFGSRSVSVGGQALLMSLVKVKEKATKIAAHQMGVEPDQVTFKDGTFTVEDIPESQMTFAEVAGQAYSAVNLPPDTEPGLEAVSFFDPENFIPVKKGDVLEFACHYENFTDQPVTNGSSGETDEMCIFGAAYVPYHGILLCQPEGTTCPDNPIRESVDPNSSLCAHYMDCMGRCGGLNIPCNNCCTPAMHPDCMMCMQGLLGCAMQKGCSTGYANFDLGCISEHCGELFAECFLTPLDP